MPWLDAAICPRPALSSRASTGHHLAASLKGQLVWPCSFALTETCLYDLDMKITGFDHIVLCVGDVDLTLEFYERVLGMAAREERAGKWSLHFGSNKISLQDARTASALAEKTVPGSGNFCVATETPIEEVVHALHAYQVEIVEGP